MSHWNLRFLQMAESIAHWSKDPSTKVGAVIFNPATRALLPAGYNGLPRGIEDSFERLNDRPLKIQMVVHAEVNAILNCARHGISTDQMGLASSLYPCAACAGVLVQAGIRLLVSREPDWQHARWGGSFMLASQVLREGGVEVVLLPQILEKAA